MEPIEFIYPLAHLIAAEEAYRLHAESSLKEFSEKAFRGGGDWIRYSFEFQASVHRYALKMHFKAIITTLKSLEHPYGDFPWSNQESVLRSKKGSAVLRDYNSLLETASSLLDDLNSIETRSISHRSVIQSQNSIEQSDSLSRLTTLAFFFVPLSFATSIFGMNVKELGSGTVKMQIVVKTMAWIFAFVMVAQLLSGPISKTLYALRTNSDGIRFRARVLKAFAAISPLGAFWLLLFGLTHNPDTFTVLVRELGIWGVLGLGDEWDKPSIGQDAQQLKLSRFWQNKAQGIASITGRKGWQKDNFWKRMRGFSRGERRRL